MGCRRPVHRPRGAIR
ncbi:MAG: hypothetical protein DMD27_05115 [Gemmatimonadetes bacterium]|nr:MAG: hypothetical protein DMD27_05115 [Gemmatimonadota bacterium]